MKEKLHMDVNEEEQRIILFYRSLNKERQEMFLKFLESLKVLLHDDENNTQM